MMASLLYTNHIQPQDIVSAENGEDLNQTRKHPLYVFVLLSLEASVDLSPCVILNHHHGLIG